MKNNNHLPSSGFAPDIVARIKAEIRHAQSIVVMSHVRPDGDAVGSILAMGLALEKAGKTVQMVLVDGVPASTRFLPGTEKISKTIAKPFDYVIVVDSSDLERIGEILPPGKKPDLNIDHHPTNLRFASLNLIDEQAVSTTTLLVYLIQELGLTITEDIASALLTGLVTDTLGFRTENMTPGVLRLAAWLMEAGADLPVIFHQALNRRTYEASRLWGIGLSNLRRSNGLIWTSISLEERRSVGYNGLDDADLVNLLTSIDGSEVGLIFLEQPDGHVKISWRSKLGYDISELAFQFGGGGHKNAAGALVSGSLNAVTEQVIRATRQHLAQLKATA
jgi:phosphoesterase RecJ-like protein